MCGIAGIFGVADHGTVKRMIDAMAHRGPDDEGIYLDKENHVALGHRRLSIIDPSPAGHQPMSYDNGRYWIVHNGEIYNFAEIRSELEKKGYPFSSSTDTEVILASYAEWGKACLHRFRGMFAFAVWDEYKRSLLLARDRFGIKPLYYSQSSDRFIFASEIKTMLASGLVSKKIDRQAVWDYLSLAAIPPPRTILAEVSALLPGHYIIIDESGICEHQYWDLAANSNDIASSYQWSYQEAKRELRKILDETIKLHMISDVPVGAFLSGGIDSTAIVGLMSQHLNRPLKTYSVGFDGQDSQHSELPWARIASKRFRTDHYEIIVSPKDVINEFDRFIESIDQPSGDGINTYFVSKAAREGVTVVLSGLGGDELFGGYPHFLQFIRAQRFLPEGNKIFRKVLQTIGSTLPSKWRRDLEFMCRSPIDRHASIRECYSEAKKSLLMSDNYKKGFHFDDISGFYLRYIRPTLTPVKSTTYVETKGYMAHTLLRDSDATSMIHSLELRVPLVDHVLAEFVFQLPDEFKVSNKRTKIILIDAINDIVPKPIVQRSKKGFKLPIANWLAGPLKELRNDIFDHGSRDLLFDPMMLRNIMKDFDEGRIPYMRVWSIMILSAWMNANGCEL